MVFNSYIFLIFFVAFFFLYWFVLYKNVAWQNLLIVSASYFFYGWWDWRFTFLMLFYTVVNYVVAQLIQREVLPSKRKLYLVTGVVVSLSLLCFFKYFNFFIGSWNDFSKAIGLYYNIPLWEIILPVGISFYTFQTLSYVIDVYQRKIVTNRSFVEFAAYVSFFPQLVAGPIERATHLLPQFSRRREFRFVDAKISFMQIIFGLFKKIVIADNCAVFVNKIWMDYQTLDGSVLVMGVILFAFQIYCDFSAYSDIAIGTSKLLGFDLMTNFRYPYFSRNIAEFWKRWHISLTTWFKDYVYIPLGGSRYGKYKTLRNVMIIFLLSGLWHGANWTFVVWGMINAVFFIPVLFAKKLITSGQADRFFWPVDFLKIAFTFFVVCFGWIFFRSATIAEAIGFIQRCFDWNEPLSWFFSTKVNLVLIVITMCAILQLLWVEWRNRFRERILFKNEFLASVILIIEMVFLGSYKNHFDFIYFQF